MKPRKLHHYFCKDCETDNFITWKFKTSLGCPHCCECGSDKQENFEYRGEIDL